MKANNKVVTIRDFAMLIHRINKSDRDSLAVCSGFTGSGKSTFTTQLQKEYSLVSGVSWDFDHMTWERSELMGWIDGVKDSDKDSVTGLYKNQKPEYSAILADELFHMFYKRKWQDSNQIDAIATFNMCRDRHLFLCGNVPNFWNLDRAFQERVRFFIYIPKRGTAWVFEQEDNPFTNDPWNVTENLKRFRKNKNPYYCTNYLFEIHFGDWDDEEKERYLEIRNRKRKDALNKEEKEEKLSSREKKLAIACGHLVNHLYTEKGYTMVKISNISHLQEDTLIRYSDMAKANIPNLSL